MFELHVLAERRKHAEIADSLGGVDGEPVDGFIFVVSTAALIIISEACVVAWCLEPLCCYRGKHMGLNKMRTPCPFFSYSFGVTVTPTRLPLQGNGG